MRSKPDDWTRVEQIKTDTAKMITDVKNKYYTIWVTGSVTQVRNKNILENFS